MRAESSVFSLADAQLGLVTRAQAFVCGMSDDQIRRRVRAGSLVRVHAGVYRAAGSASSLEQRALAACLASGPEAFASHATAGALWGITVAKGEPSIEVTVRSNRRPHHQGVVVHRSRLIRPVDWTRRGPVPVATAARTLLDLAAKMSEPDLEEAVDEAFRKGLLVPRRLLSFLRDPALERAAGSGILRSLASDRLAGGIPESVLESRMLATLRDFALPSPTRQLEVREQGRVVRFDLAYPDQRLAIELDGRAPHWGKSRWQSDHDRHNVTEIAAWRTLRFTWSDVTERPLYVALTVGEALGLRPTGWSSPSLRNSPSPAKRVHHGR